MQNKNSKKGRRRKVIRQGKAHLSFTGKGVTAHGGMALVARGMGTFGVREALELFGKDFDHRSHHGTAGIVEQLIALRLMGGQAMSDTQILKDTALQAMFGWSAVAHPTTFSRRLGEFSYKSNQALQQIASHLSRLTQGSGKRLIAIDSTVATAHGESMEGAQIGYNPHKPGRPSYHPLLAVDVRGRSVVDGYLRPGSAGTGNGLVGFIKKISAEKKGKAQDIIFRLDKGLTSGAALDAIEEQGSGYVAKHKLTSRLMTQISGIKKF